MSKKKSWFEQFRYNISRKGWKEYNKYFEETHDKAHGIGKYRKKRKR